MKKDSQILKVLQAVRSGCNTSFKVAQHTGFDRKTCTAHLSVLTKMGRIQMTGKVTEPHTRLYKTNNYIAK